MRKQPAFVPFNDASRPFMKLSKVCERVNVYPDLTDVPSSLSDSHQVSPAERSFLIDYGSKPSSHTRSLSIVFQNNDVWRQNSGIPAGLVTTFPTKEFRHDAADTTADK